MLATRIVRETTDDIFGDLRGAFVCLMPLIAAFAALFAGGFLFLAGMPLEVVDENGMLDVTLPGVADAFFAIFCMATLLTVAWAWTAVAWHRKVVLAEEPKSLFPLWPGGRILGYLGRAILVSLLASIASIPLLIVASAIAPNMASFGEGGMTESYEYTMGEGPTDFSPLGLLVWLVLSGLVYGLFLRLSLILPAGAVGQAVGLGQVWDRTKGHYFSLFVPLGLLISLISTVLTLIASFVSFGGVMDILALGLVTLLGIGVLTRLYLHFFPSSEPHVPPLDPVLS